MQLREKVAIVTGASRGLGAHLARRLCEEGAHVVIADIQPCGDRLEEWPAELRDRCRFRETDVRRFDDVRSLVDGVVEELGGIDVLVNNASVFSALSRRPFQELGAEDWERSYSVNVMGTFHCTKAVFPHMKERGSGKIVNIASDAVFKGLPMMLDYVAAKGAVVAMTRALARELGPYDIQVNAVAPGYIRHDDNPNWSEERNEQVIRLRSLQRTEVPADVAGAVVFLASGESDFMTGQTLVVDGGEVLR